jgi:nickel transport protein
MKRVRRVLVAGLLGACLLGPPNGLYAQTPDQESQAEIITLLKEQNRHLSGDLRGIHREIAALRADMDKPNFKDIFSGIGYILGLFGVAAFVAARRKE